jgi:hypothetical protein
MEIKFHILLCNISTGSPDRSECYYAYDQQKPHLQHTGLPHVSSTFQLHCSWSLFIADTPRADSHTDGTQRDVCMLSILYKYAHRNKMLKKLEILRYFMRCEVYGIFYEMWSLW